MVFEEIAFSARVAFWTRCWTLLASLSGAFWPPRWLKPLLEFLLERPRAVQDFFFQPQQRPKERPISPWKPPLGRPSLFKSSKRSPRGLQKASRANLAAMLVPFWSHIGAISKRCCHHVGHVSSLKLRQGPSIQGPRPGGMRVSDSIRRPTAFCGQTVCCTLPLNLMNADISS